MRQGCWKNKFTFGKPNRHSSKWIFFDHDVRHINYIWSPHPEYGEAGIKYGDVCRWIVTSPHRHGTISKYKTDPLFPIRKGYFLTATFLTTTVIETREEDRMKDILSRWNAISFKSGRRNKIYDFIPVFSSLQRDRISELWPSYV